MSPQTTVFPIMIFLHDLFTATWVGGLIAMSFTFLPTARRVLGKGPQTKQLMDEILKRQSILVYISMAGLMLTGLLMSNNSPQFTGLFSFANPYVTLLSIKHVLVLLMIAFALYRSLVLGRGGKMLTASQEKLKVILLLATTALGIVVLLLSGFLAAMG
jgi:putative copper export protein